MDTYVKWTDEEWAALAKRAAALKAAKPDMSWTQIVPVCQDDIAPERRRFTINKLSGLKPMFDILDLDEHGNPKPPPPPPPAPEPELPPAPTTVANPPFSTSLKDVPIDLLISEIFARGTTLKQDMESLAKMEASIKATLAEHSAKVDLTLKRIDEVEALVLKSMDDMETINGTYTRMMKASEEMSARFREKFGTAPPEPEELDAREIEMNLRPRPAGPEPRMNPIRFLLLGPYPKDITRIKEHLPRSFNVELIYGENSEAASMPANIHYCIVSGHHDWHRRWNTAKDKYGAKAIRVANGSIGAFTHQIEDCYFKTATNGK